MEPAIARAPAFSETMPSRYRQLFSGLTVHEHAAIAGRRRGAPAHAEIWRRLPQGGAIVCVVTEDQPGVLSHLGTVLTTQAIDLLAAQVYGRATPRGPEVVDLLWLRRDETLAPSLVDADVARIADLLGGLVTGALRVDARRLGAGRPSSDVATLVRFDDSVEAGRPATLLLETLERPGLFRAVIDALVGTGIRIIASRRASGGGGRVMHRFVVSEGNGAPPDQYRRGMLQAEVLRVVELMGLKPYRHGIDDVLAREPDAEAIVIDEAHPVFA